MVRYLLPEDLELTHLQQVGQVEDVLHPLILQDILETHFTMRIEDMLGIRKVVFVPGSFWIPEYRIHIRLFADPEPALCGNADPDLVLNSRIQIQVLVKSKKTLVQMTPTKLCYMIFEF